MNNPKLTRKEQAINTKHKLFNSALELFTTHSPENVSIEMITKHAGVSKGSFYVHFKSKNALITELATKKVSEVDFDYEIFLKKLPIGVTSSEMLLLVGEKIMSVMIDHIGYEQLRIMYEALLEKNEDINSVTSSNRKIYSVLSYIVNMGIELDEFRNDLPAEVVAQHLLIILRGLTYQWCVMYPNFDLQSMTEQHLMIFLNGLKKHNK